MLRALEAHIIDVLLANVSPPRDAATPWVAHPIAKQAVSLVGHPTRTRRPKNLKALLSSEPLVLPASESSIRAGFDALVNRLGVRPRIAAEVDDMAMLRLLARERIGLAVVPSIVVEDELRAGVLVEIAPLPLVETFFAITLARRFPNPLLKSLIREGDPGGDHP
jgi:LysR family transcriptional activator of nhaA